MPKRRARGGRKDGDEPIDPNAPPPSPKRRPAKKTTAKDRERQKGVYTEEIADIICERIMNGESIRAISADEDMPSRFTILAWLRKHPEFTKQYEISRQVQADLMFEEVLEIADNASNDWMERNDPRNPGWRLNGEHVKRSALRVDTRKWVLARMNPKKYGDKIEQTLRNDPSAPWTELRIDTDDPQEAARMYREMMAAGQVSA